VSDCLFDAIAYLLKYSINSTIIQKNNLLHLKEPLRLGTPKVLECHRSKLKFEFLHDLHHGNANDKETYIFKMSILTIHGGLRGDFITIFWIFEYLRPSIHVWNKSNGRIMVKIKQENVLTLLNLIYGNNHFELAEIYLQTINIPIHVPNDDKKRKKVLIKI
jgi:hypothetical protein